MSLAQQGLRVVAEACSVYPERNEAIVNAGLIALSRGWGMFPGFARSVDQPEWNIGRCEEHGILACSDDRGLESGGLLSRWSEADASCSTRMYHCGGIRMDRWFFVVDDNDVVQDAWFPWRGW